MPHASNSQGVRGSCVWIMIYHDVQTSESLVPNCSGSSSVGGRGLISTGEDDGTDLTVTSREPPARTRRNRSVLQASGPGGDPGLATRQAVPLPKPARLPALPVGRNQPTDARVAPAALGRSSRARCPGTQQVGIPGRCHH